MATVFTPCKNKEIWVLFFNIAFATTSRLMPDTTYSVGFDYKNFNETNYAKELSDKLGVENVRKMITADEFFDALPDIQYHMSCRNPCGSTPEPSAERILHVRFCRFYRYR